MKTTQTGNGKSFEYALAIALGDATKIPIENNGEFALAAACFKCQTDGHEEILEHAAKEAVNFLVENDERISHCTNISLQKDSCGKTGDARDIVIRVKNGEIGISAKKNHSAIKHSRLSQSIDFGNVWTGFPCNKSYFDAIEPTFEELKRLQYEKLLFKDIPRIKETIYLPIITAFEDELRTLTDQHGMKFVKNLFGYMIGKHDFYKMMVFPQKKQLKFNL